VAGIGERVGPGAAPLAIVHAASEVGAEAAAAEIRAAFTLGDAASPPAPVVARRLAAG
jgi:thymidine phosphorylase